MPEGPEVKIMTDKLNRFIKKTSPKPCIFEKLSIISGRYVKHGMPENYYKFNTLLEKSLKTKDTKNKPILQKANNKGKFMWLAVTVPNSKIKSGVEEWYIMLTFGYGHILFEKGEHTRAIFETSNGEFYFDDMRNFGTIIITNDIEQLNEKLNRLGPDILTTIQTMKFPEFKSIIIPKSKRNKKSIALLLLEQKVLSGIGNYLRSEIIYDADINPFISSREMTDAELRRLLKSIKKISMKSYNHQKKNGIHSYPFEVYQKKTDSKGKPVLQKKLKDKRTFWYSVKYD